MYLFKNVYSNTQLVNFLKGCIRCLFPFMCLYIYNYQEWMVKLNEEVVIDNINVFQVSSVIWALIKNPVKESFYGKRKKSN